MTKIKFTTLFVLVIFLSAFVALAQPNSLRGRSSIELDLGLWHELKAANEIATSGITSIARSGGFIGGLSYKYWLQEDLSVSVEVGLLSGEATSSVSISGIYQRTSTVIPVLLGVRYYVPQPSPDALVRPFVSLAAGPFLGFEAKNTALSQSTRSEMALGTRLGVGVEFLLGQNFKPGAHIGYHVMTNYSNPIGARKNYNGPEFSLGFGIIFGEAKP